MSQDTFVGLKKMGWIAYVIAAIIAIASGPITIPIILAAWFMIWILKPKELHFMKPGENSYIPDKDMFDQFFGWAVNGDPKSSHQGEEYFSSAYSEFKNSSYYSKWDEASVDKDDPYTILGIDKSVSDAELKDQYRRLVKQYHPDLGPETDRQSRSNKTLLIIDAYHRIKDTRTIKI